MRGLIEVIAQALVDDPSKAQVDEIQSETLTVLDLRVGPGDAGKVIGRQGRTARAIRTILTANPTKLRRRAVLEILE